MIKVGISLGWNCYAAIYAVEHSLRNRKSEGYMTCPFDEMITNLAGIKQCLIDDFKYFLDDKYLKLINAPFSTGGIVKGETLLYNTKYHFIFNHESPGHANLYISQNWEGGINHYTKDNFKLFKQRYEERISNFRNYLNSADEILFIIHGNENDTINLDQLFSEKNINHKIIELIDIEQYKEHYKLMMIE